MFQITSVNQPAGLKFTNYSTFAGDMVSRILPFAIIAAGLFFFARLVLAGYTYLTSLGDSGKVQNATKEITNSVIGFLVVLCSFFIAQILQVVFGIKIL